MLKITYNMHSHQKWAFGETEDTDERTFYGQDEFDIRRQIDDVLNSWYQDPAVKSVRFEEVSREELEEPK